MATIGTVQEHCAALFSRRKDAVLLGALAEIKEDSDAAGGLTEEERLAHAWICGELERRHPHIADGIGEWAENLDSAETYADVLIRLIASKP